jgi:hypothetical protein
MSQLVPCRACQRHVKSDETSCLSCQAVSPARPCTGACSGLPSARLARAALVAAGAALLGAACSSNSAIVPYGIPPQFDAGAEAPQDGEAPTDGAPDADDAAK